MGPIVIEVERWHSQELCMWRLGTVDRRGTLHEMMRGGTGGPDAPGFTRVDECRIAATDAAIEWANQILMADRMEARRG